MTTRPWSGRRPRKITTPWTANHFQPLHPQYLRFKGLQSPLRGQKCPPGTRNVQKRSISKTGVGVGTWAFEAESFSSFSLSESQQFPFSFQKKPRAPRRRALQQDRMEKAETDPHAENAHRQFARERIPEALPASATKMVIGKNSHRRFSQNPSLRACLLQWRNRWSFHFLQSRTRKIGNIESVNCTPP